MQTINAKAMGMTEDAIWAVQIGLSGLFAIIVGISKRDALKARSPQSTPKMIKPILTIDIAKLEESVCLLK